MNLFSDAMEADVKILQEGTLNYTQLESLVVPAMTVMVFASQDHETWKREI